MSWWDSIGKGLEAIGVLTEWSEKDKAIRHNAEVAKYNRLLDRINLGLGIKRSEDEVALNDQRIEDMQYQRHIARSDRLHAETVSGFHRDRMTYLGDLADSESRHMMAVTNSRYAAQHADHRVRMAQLRVAGRVDRATLAALDAEHTGEQNILSATLEHSRLQGLALDATGRAATDNYAAGRHRRSKQVARLQVGQIQQQAVAGQERELLGARGRTAAARRRSIMQAGQAQIGAAGARRVRLNRNTEIAQRERIELGARTVGAAVAEEAGRGVSGSGRATAAAEEAKATERDLQVMQLQRDIHLVDMTEREALARADMEAKLAQVDETQARIGRDRASQVRQEAIFAADHAVSFAQLSEEDTRARGEYTTQQAQLAAQRGALNLRNVGAQARFDTGVAQRAVTETEVSGRMGYRELQEDAYRKQNRLHADQYLQGRDQAEFRRRRGILDVARAGIDRGESDLRGMRATAQEMGYDTEIDRLNRDTRMAGLEKEFAEWQLDTLPSLPDYEGMRTGNTIRSFLEIMRL